MNEIVIDEQENIDPDNMPDMPGVSWGNACTVLPVPASGESFIDALRNFGMEVYHE